MWTPELVIAVDELATVLPVSTAASSARRVPIFSVPLPDPILAGDLLQVKAEFEATNPASEANVGLWCYLVLGGNASPSGVMLTRSNGENVTPAGHHAQRTKAVDWQAEFDNSTLTHVTLIAYAASSWSTRPASLAVEQHYGHLTVTRWRDVPNG